MSPISEKGNRMRAELGTAYGVEDLNLVADLLSGAGIGDIGAEGNRTVGYQLSIPAPDLERALEVIRSSQALRSGELLFLFPGDEGIIEAERQGFDGFLKWRHECHEKRHTGSR